MFNKGLDEDDKKEGLFKRLIRIKDKNEKQLKAFEDHGKKTIGYRFIIIKFNQLF